MTGNARFAMTQAICFAITISACTGDGSGGTSNDKLPVSSDGEPEHDGGGRRGPALDAGGSSADGGRTVDGETGGRRDAAVPGGDAAIDDGCVPSLLYRDTDHDGFGDSKTMISRCGAEPGYVADSTDCDDRLATVHPGADETCDRVDQDCDGKVDGTPTQQAACTALNGSYAGPYVMHTTEKLNTTVVNDMLCSGRAMLTIDVEGANAVSGTAICARSKGTFDAEQFATIAGTVRPDGVFVGTLVHEFTSDTSHEFALKGKVGPNGLVLEAMDMWKPNPGSVVPWEVDYSVKATKL